jgi:hypothetical protein
MNKSSIKIILTDLKAKNIEEVVEKDFDEIEPDRKYEEWRDKVISEKLP